MRRGTLAILAAAFSFFVVLASVVTADDITAIAVETRTAIDPGIIRHTTDGGGNWYPRESGTDSLYDVDCVGNHCWAVGHAGVILHSADGGITWNPQDPQFGQDIRSVDFTDLLNGWVAGNGEILHTNDGGDTWQPQATFTGDMQSIVFVNELVGWAANSEGVIRHTIDGGENWGFQTSGTDDEITAIEFVDENTGWFVTDDVFGSTSDGGAHWQTTNSVNGLGVDFIDEHHGWAVGKSRTIEFTNDGGIEWTTQNSSGSDNDLLYDVAFVDRLTGWAVGSGGTVLHTVDGGANWLPQTVGTTASVYAITAFRQTGADFDGDGDVDGNDFLVWQSSFGIDADGDADNDGDTDGNDFLVWQNEFEAGSGLASTAVPEPPSILMLFVVLAAAVWVRSRVKRCEDY